MRKSATAAALMLAMAGQLLTRTTFGALGPCETVVQGSFVDTIACGVPCAGSVTITVHQKACQGMDYSPCTQFAVPVTITYLPIAVPSLLGVCSIPGQAPKWDCVQDLTTRVTAGVGTNCS